MTIDNYEQVLAVLDTSDRVLGAFHGHVHLNQTFARRGVQYAITSGLNSYSMMWRQVCVESDRVEVRSCQLDLPDLLDRSFTANPVLTQTQLGTETERTLTIRRRSCLAASSDGDDRHRIARPIICSTSVSTT